MGNAAETGASGSQGRGSIGDSAGSAKLPSSTCCKRENLGKLGGAVSRIEESPSASDEGKGSGGSQERLGW